MADISLNLNTAAHTAKHNLILLNICTYSVKNYAIVRVSQHIPLITVASLGKNDAESCQRYPDSAQCTADLVAYGKDPFVLSGK